VHPKGGKLFGDSIAADDSTPTGTTHDSGHLRTCKQKTPSYRCGGYDPHRTSYVDYHPITQTALNRFQKVSS